MQHNDVGNYDSVDNVNGTYDVSVDDANGTYDVSVDEVNGNVNKNESVADVNVWPSTNSTCGFTPTAPACLLAEPQCPATIFTAESYFTFYNVIFLRMQCFAF